MGGRWGKAACKHQKELLDAETEKRTDLDLGEKYKMGILWTLKFWHRMCGGGIKRDLTGCVARWNSHSYCCTSAGVCVTHLLQGTEPQLYSETLAWLRFVYWSEGLKAVTLQK